MTTSDFNSLPWILALVLSVAVLPESAGAQPEQPGRSGIQGRSQPGSKVGGGARVSGSPRVSNPGGSRGGSVGGGGSRGHRGGNHRYGHSGRGHHGGRSYYGGRGYYGGSYYRPFGYYNSYFYHFPTAYLTGYSGYGYGPRYYDYPGPEIGAVDINVKPKKAQVYVDGDYVGTVDNFDGFPRYLWLREGTRHLVIHREGFETLARRVKVRAGEVVDLRERMVPGDAKEPSEFFVDLPSPRSVDSRSEASDRPRSVDSRVEGDRAVQSERPSATWRERRPRPTTEPLDRDLRAEPATLRLTLEPADAVVYLDGRLLGSGEELDMLHSSLLIDPGSHELEAVRPGYETRVIDFDAKAGREIELEIELERR